VIDLDAIQERIDRVNPHKPPVDRGAERTLAVVDAPALVAELRAAREVVEAARQAANANLHEEDWPTLLTAIRAYDQAVGGGS
jgi:hypothetical protein